MPQSHVERRQSIVFPEFTGERTYMYQFNKATLLPLYLRRWQRVVDAMLEGLNSEKSIFLTIDQRFVESSKTHRRPGVHVDGIWVPNLYLDEEELDEINPRASHYTKTKKGHITPSGHVMPNSGGHRFDDLGSQTLVLASSVLGSRAFIGNYEGYPKAGGDYSHIDLSQMKIIDLVPNFAWIGDADTMLHEAIAVNESCFRTFVRLNVVN